MPAVNCDTVTVWSTTRGAENVLESSIWTRYDAAALTSVQSSVTGSGSVAPLAGLTSDGAEGVGGAEGFTVSVVDRVTPPPVPEIVAAIEVVTEVVVTAKVALVAPADTVTLVGTVVAVELSASVTTAPPVGAADVNVTVPVEDVPPATLVGLTDTAERVGPAAPGVTVNTAVCVTGP